MSQDSIPNGTHASPELVEELRSFLGNLDQRTPQEAIGIEDSGGLVSSMLVSAAGFVVLLLILTAIPYFTPGTEAVADKKPAVSDSAEESGSGAAEVPVQPGSSMNADVPVANPEEVMDRLNIGETKDANPNENPLDSPNLDRLLDGDN